MCCVMPPASPAATSVWRIASSSDVLPWSTWPMIVTTGGRGSSSSSASSNSGSASASSAAETISISLSNSSARIWIVSSDRVCVTMAISPRPISFLMISGTGTPRYSETSLTVEPELIRIVCALSWGRPGGGLLEGAAPAPASASPRRAPRGVAAGTAARAARTAARTAPGGLGVDDDAADAAARAGARSPCSEERVGRCGWRRPGRRPAPCRRPGRCGPAAAAGAPAARAAARPCAPAPAAGGAGAPPARRASSAGEAHAAAGRSLGLGLRLGAVARLLGRSLAGERASASPSSTADAAALTFRPYALRRFITSAVGMSYCLASSWTRFLAMCV